MKIALLTNGIYPFNMGGMQKHSYYLTRYFAQCNIYVDVYHVQSKRAKQYTISNYFKPSELEYLTFYKIEFPSSLYFPGHYLFNSYRYSCRIYHLLKQQLVDIDYIYVQGFTGWKLLQEKKSGKKIPPVGLNFHGFNMFQIAGRVRTKLEHFLFRYPVNFCLLNADIAYSLGGKLTDIIRKRVGTSTKILETPIGIEEKWLTKNPKIPNQRRKFIFIGRFERCKGIKELSAVIKRIQDKYEFDFEFIGPIPQKKRLKLSKCTYHGPIYDEDKIIKIVSKCDILVCPSYSEGMPTVILEAMARGLAVIATDVGAVNELVSTETGWLIEAANLTHLEDAVINAISLPEKQLLKKKEAALKLIEDKFTWVNIIAITLDQIKKHIGNSKIAC